MLFILFYIFLCIRYSFLVREFFLRVFYYKEILKRIYLDYVILIYLKRLFLIFVLMGIFFLFMKIFEILSKNKREVLIFIFRF